jgi:uncharacterized protein (TIGR00369 family)
MSAKRSASPPPALDRDAMKAFLAKVFPEIDQGEGPIRIEAVEWGHALLRLDHDPRHLRPGGTISGPTMMALADYALYVAVLSVVGPEPLAVTIQFSISFLAKPAPAALIADCRLLKAGKRLCVGEVSIRAEGAEALLAHATGTYSVPPRRAP